MSVASRVTGVPMKRSLLASLFAPVCFCAAALGQTGEAFMVVEAHSGKVLMASNSVVTRPVASLTKIATGVIAVDWADATGVNLNETFATVPAAALSIGGPNPLGLQPGDRMTLRDALYSALLGSDNLAAMTVADHVGREILRARGRSGDGVSAFVAEMNELGKAIRLTGTRFANPHGLELPRRTGRSTAADVARLSIYAMRKPGFTFIVRQKDRQVTVHGADGQREFRVKNTNELVGEPMVLGVKTGTTAAAGPCLSVAVDREPLVREKPNGDKAVTPRRLVVVVLNSPDRFNRARGLISQGWAAYDRWVAGGAMIGNRNREILDVPNPR
ncbi:MAG: D-alanyl-D-alanine carboxypeptidase [Verrucomicrobia bacterium]|nr:MAG: D-alanyl-D-alanine carboxypeptidase [Verrucomicrobiota bacterium]TAE85255.1 MAG: D-alanyl-D-alanine carboxypeptidase [Verrucomicrobiota bacterium]TAF23016.1 MAG: D-alanyl-D-alanine carboxypeptidase [Verrucomicrobiota bacterium]